MNAYIAYIKGQVQQKASDSRLNNSIAVGHEWIIPHILNILDILDTQPEVHQIIAQLASQPQETRDSIYHLSNVPEPDRERYLQAGRSFIQGKFEAALAPFYPGLSSSLSTLNDQSSRDSVSSRQDPFPSSADSYNAQYAGYTEFFSTVSSDTGSQLVQGNPHVCSGELAAPLALPAQGQGYAESLSVCSQQNPHSVASSNTQNTGAEDRKARVSVEYWCAEPDCER